MTSDTSQTANHRPIRSFVRREGRLPQRTQKAWDELHKKHIKKTSDLLELIKQIKSDNKRLIIEVGSGQGNQIVHASTKYQNTVFLAFEVFHTGVAHTLLLLKNSPQYLDNGNEIYLIEADACEVFRELIKNNECVKTADEIWTFFPDPWPKKKHHKRRLINDEYKTLVSKLLKPGGILRVATDWEDYANEISLVLDVTPSDRFANRIITNFENKAINDGRSIFDFTYTNS